MKNTAGVDPEITSCMIDTGIGICAKGLPGSHLLVYMCSDIVCNVYTYKVANTLNTAIVM